MKTTKVTPHITETKENQTPNTNFWPAVYLLWQAIQTLLYLVGERLRKVVMVPAPTGLLLLAIFLMWRGLSPQINPQVVQYNSGTVLTPAANPEIPPPLLEDLPANEQAPVSYAMIESGSAEAYITRFAKVAKGEQAKYGIPASISLAQGLIESRAGKSYLATKANNHFGMKCFARRCPKSHCINRSDDHHKDFFRKYKSAWESYRAHSELLNGKRYARLKKHGRDYKKWAYGLEQLGYATDRSYAEKLIGVIQRYNLQKYDK